MLANGNSCKTTEWRSAEVRRRRQHQRWVVMEGWPEEVSFQLHFEEDKGHGLAEIGGYF